MVRIISSAIIFIILWSCKTGDIDFPVTGGDISIYVTSSIESGWSTNPNIDIWPLEEKPWITISDIEFYDWSAHIFYLRREKEREKYAGRWFVVASEGRRLFSGYFFPVFSSYFSPAPSILASDKFFTPLNMVEIGGFDDFFDSQTETSKAFRKTLLESGLLREGISVELVDVKKRDSHSVIYSFSVSNLDNETILVPDPDLMGAGRFHYFTNGVSLTKDKTLFFAENKTVVSSEQMDDSWYYPLQPGETIVRSVILDGFNQLPAGRFDSFFRYYGSFTNRKYFYRQEGRIWAGSITARNSFSF
jgi:hypothetical protein